MNILNLIGIFTIEDWFLIDESYLQKLKNKKDEKKHIFNNSKVNEKSFITKDKLNPGWYIFGILHLGKNNRVIGNISTGKYTFKQSRPMFPRKRRWRIIRVRNKSKLSLELTNIEEFLDLREIWIIKVPFFEAKRRIKKRLRNNFNILFLKKNNIANLWKKYNQLLKFQYTKSEIFNYTYWIKTVESKQNNLLKNYHLRDDVKFIKRKEGDYSPIKNNNKDWIIFIADNNTLEQNAIKIAQKIILRNPQLEIIYFDEDQINKYNKRENPNFKTSWNRELFFSNPNFVTSCFIKASKWNESIKFLSNNKYIINIYSILILISFNLEKEGNINKISHVPYVGFHNNGSLINRRVTAINSGFLLSFLKKNKKFYGDATNIKLDKNGLFNTICWAVPKETLISILIPTRDKLNLLKQCINSIEEFKPRQSVEILIINNDSKKLETLRYFAYLKKINNFNFPIKIIDIPGEFNYSKFNNIGCKYSKGNVLLFLNNDVYFIKDGWGNALAQNALREDIGCVGAKLFYENKTIQHAGVIIGIGGVAGHSQKYFSAYSSGYQNRLILTQEFSAVTGACLAISKKNFERLNGFDQDKLKVNYNDVDLCLRARKIGLKNIFLPNVHAIHLESKSRGKPHGKSLNQWKKESKFFKNKWYNFTENDPFYSVNLSLENEQYSLNLKQADSIKYRLGNQSIYNRLIN